MPTQVVWTGEEDDLLRDLVEKYGTKCWTKMASYFPGKNGKQCRRRWKNSIEIEAKATIWSQEEDQKLINWHQEHGNKWTTISALFGDRTDNAVKNRWHALCRKQPDLANKHSEGRHTTMTGVRRGTKTRHSGSEDWPSSAGSPFNPKRRTTTSSGRTGGRSNNSHQAPSIPTPFDRSNSVYLGYNVLPRDLEYLAAKDQVEVKEIKDSGLTNTQDIQQVEALFQSQSTFRDGQGNGESAMLVPHNLTDLLTELVSSRDIGVNDQPIQTTQNVSGENGIQRNASIAKNESFNLFPGEAFSCAASSSSFTSSQREFLARFFSQSQNCMGGGSREGSFRLPMGTESLNSLDLQLLLSQNFASQSFSGDQQTGGTQAVISQSHAADIYASLQRNRNSSVLSNRNQAIAAAIAAVDQSSQPKVINDSCSPRKAFKGEKSVDYVEIDKMFEEHTTRS
jgi:hypothetical protein